MRSISLHFWTAQKHERPGWGWRRGDWSSVAGGRRWAAGRAFSRCVVSACVLHSTFSSSFPSCQLPPLSSLVCFPSTKAPCLSLPLPNWLLLSDSYPPLVQGQVLGINAEAILKAPMAPYTLNLRMELVHGKSVITINHKNAAARKHHSDIPLRQWTFNLDSSALWKDGLHGFSSIYGHYKRLWNG